MKWTALLGAFALAGCQAADGTTYLGRPGSPAWFATASSQTIAEYFGQRCSSYGFQSGTPDMARCIQSEAQSQRGNNTLKMSAAAANANATMNANRMRTTNCTGFGNTVNCTSY